MKKEKTSLFWIVTLFFVLAWIVAGTQSVLYILQGEVNIGKAIIISTAILLVIVYYAIEWWIIRKY